MRSEARTLYKNEIGMVHSFKSRHGDPDSLTITKARGRVGVDKLISALNNLDHPREQIDATVAVIQQVSHEMNTLLKEGGVILDKDAKEIIYGLPDLSEDIWFKLETEGTAGFYHQKAPIPEYKDYYKIALVRKGFSYKLGYWLSKGAAVEFVYQNDDGGQHSIDHISTSFHYRTRNLLTTATAQPIIAANSVASQILYDIAQSYGLKEVYNIKLRVPTTRIRNY